MPVFNQFISTRPRTSRRQRGDSGATAGAGKVSSGGGKSRGELEALAARHGWAPRQLNAHDVTAMGADELRYHEVFNSAALEKTFTSQKVEKYNAEVRTNQAANRMWRGEATEEESQKAFAAGDRFASNYSSFLRTEANAKKITEYMEQNNLDATDVRSYVQAFDVLAPEEKLTLSPKQAGIGPEETLTGAALQQYPRLHLLCMPKQALKPEDKLSADEYFQLHPELRDTRTPPLMQKQILKDAHTAAFQKQTEEATASTRDGKTKVVDYPQEQHGVPPQPEKASFRKKINSMTADQVQQECAINPAFRKSLDEME